jgi:hypothetical protein
VCRPGKSAHTEHIGQIRPLNAVSGDRTRTDWRSGRYQQGLGSPIFTAESTASNSPTVAPADGV